jgi:hypothetical protein
MVGTAPVKNVLKPTRFHGRCEAMELALDACRPVRSEYRAGVHSGEGVYALAKAAPPAPRASESMAGESPWAAP